MSLYLIRRNPRITDKELIVTSRLQSRALGKRGRNVCVHIPARIRQVHREENTMGKFQRNEKMRAAKGRSTTTSCCVLSEVITKRVKVR